MKTAKRKSSLLLLIMIIAAVFMMTPQSFAAANDGDNASSYVTDNNKNVKIESKSGAVLDRNSGLILYDKNADQKMYPASCTKVLTALVTLENAKDLKKRVTVSQEAIDSLEEGSSHIALVPGEIVTIEDLLYGLLLESGNDCANVLAEEIGGSKEGFAEMMNKKAKELGANDSHFVNPHGMPNKDHYTTSHDLAVIMNACVRNEQFVKIDSALKYKIKKTNKSKSRELWNSHRMIKNKYAFYDGVIGGKTGFTKQSKCCLITYAKKNGMDLIVVVMRNGTPHGCVEDTKALLDFYLKKHHVASSAESLPDKENFEGTLKVGRKDVKYIEKTAPDVIIPAKASGSDLVVEKTFDEDLELPVEKDQKIGTAYISYDNRLLGETDIVSTEKVDSDALLITILCAAACVLIFIVAAALMMRSKKKKRRN